MKMKKPTVTTTNDASGLHTRNDPLKLQYLLVDFTGKV